MCACLPIYLSDLIPFYLCSGYALLPTKERTHPLLPLFHQLGMNMLSLSAWFRVGLSCVPNVIEVSVLRPASTR